MASIDFRGDTLLQFVSLDLCIDDHIMKTMVVNKMYHLVVPVGV